MAGLWDSDTRFPRNSPVFMRSSSSLARVLVKGGGLALLCWLLVPSVVVAASAAGRDTARVCNPWTLLTLHKLARVARSISGPVAHPFTRAPLDLSDGGVRLDHSVPPIPSDDDAAIQNDAPAACVDADANIAFVLAPIGLLARVCVHQPKARDFSPRSPRGPPVAV